jgi:enediyne biosynthesis protein CalE5
MYLADPPGTLRRLRRFLKPGGRLAASTWAGPDQVAFAAPMPLILEMLELPPPPPDRPGLFALADRDRLAQVVAQAGYGDVRTGTVTAVFAFPSPEDAIQFLRDCAPPVTALVDQQPPEVREQVWQRVTDQAWSPFIGAGGQVRLPSQAHWVTASNPT